MPLTIYRSALAALRQAADAAAPHEACGLLVGDLLRDGERIAATHPAANIAADPLTRFEIDPIALIAAHRAARGGGPALLGYYHSHPAGHPRPSATDCEHASGDGRLWAIVARDTVTLWRDTAQGFAALPYAVVEG